MIQKINSDILRLKDILSACADASEHAKHGFAERRNVHAVVYAIMVIGEASSKLSETLRNAHPEIPWRDIVSMRNKIVHEYGKIDVSTIRDVVSNDLPGLAAKIEVILKQLNT